MSNHMKYRPLLTALLLLLFFTAQAQVKLAVSTFEPTSDQWLLLTESRTTISENDSLNEELVDLVQVFSVDSILPSKSQRHRVAEMGWFISMFGYKWKALSRVKQKFVGTERDGIRVPQSPPFFTEYDVNFNLIPHTRRYADFLWPAYVAKRERNRFKKIKDFDKAPWIYPETFENIHRYRIHCELTPPVNYRAMLNEKFYPCIRPNSSAEHFNIGSNYVTYGMYGAFVADFNHTGGPEIHPYDWIWWYDTHPERLKEKSQAWYLGFMKEASNRFRGWYKKKRSIVGQAAIPFSFNLSNDSLKVNIEHLVHDNLDQEAFLRLEGVPQEAGNMYFSERSFSFDQTGPEGKVIHVSTSNPMRQEGMKMWFSDLNWDKEKSLLTGYMNIAVAVHNTYNTKVTFH